MEYLEVFGLRHVLLNDPSRTFALPTVPDSFLSVSLSPFSQWAANGASFSHPHPPIPPPPSPLFLAASHHNRRLFRHRRSTRQPPLLQARQSLSRNSFREQITPYHRIHQPSVRSQKASSYIFTSISRTYQRSKHPLKPFSPRTPGWTLSSTTQASYYHRKVAKQLRAASYKSAPTAWTCSTSRSSCGPCSPSRPKQRQNPPSASSGSHPTAPRYPARKTAST